MIHEELAGATALQHLTAEIQAIVYLNIQENVASAAEISAEYVQSILWWKMNMINKYVAPLALTALIAFTPAKAEVFTTVDLTPKEGTTWTSALDMLIAGATEQPVRIDFGAGYGMGTVTMTSFNSGHGGLVYAPGTDLGSYMTNLNYTQDLGNGDTLVSKSASVGTMMLDTPLRALYPDNGIAGLTMTFTLDSGNFSAGSLFLAGGLRQQDTLNPTSYFSPGAEFGAPLAISLPGNAGSTPIVQVGSDAFGPLYGTQAAGGSETRAFALLNDTNSFSVRFLSDPVFSKSHAAPIFAFATPSDPAGAVPEPASWAMMIVGFGAIGATMRRHKMAGQYAAAMSSAAA